MKHVKIEQDIITEIKKRLIEIYNPEYIYIYGSYVWGNPDKESDLDIAVIINESNDSPYLRPQKGTLSLWDIAYPIDLIVYTSEEFNSMAKYSGTLQSKILKDGEKVYEAA